MSTTPDPTTPAAPAPDPRDAQIAQLKTQLAAANEALSNALKPAKPSFGSKLKAKLAEIGNGLLAGVTSSAAVKAEKSLAALVVARLLLWAGAADGTVKLVQAILDAAGVTK